MKKIVISIILIVLLVGGLLAVYLIYEKPNGQVEITSANISILAKEGNNLIKTNYSINSILNQEGETSRLGYIQVSVPINQEIEISNINQENQNYYTTIMKLNLTDFSNKRVDLLLTKPKEVSVNYKKGENISVTLSSEDYRNVLICIHWLGGYISVKSNLTIIEKPENYLNYTRCYDLNKSLSGNTETFELTYKTFGTNGGEIYLATIDRDYLRGELKSYESTDLFGLDKIIKIV